jgi:Abortive infection alpha
MGNELGAISDNDSLKIEATVDGFSIEAKGTKVSRVTDALLDAISPFTSSLGMIGDQITIARKKAALRAASKAIEQLNSEGIKTAIIPPKVLIPWLEGASLETDNNETLVDAWSGLFVRAVKSSDAVTISYIETLKKIGKAEADVLQFFATDMSPDHSSQLYNQEIAQIFSDENPLRAGLVKAIESSFKIGNLTDLKELLGGAGLQGNCQIIYFSTPRYKMVRTEYYEIHEHAVSNMEHLGLVEIFTSSIDTIEGKVILTWFQITKYGFDLVWACQGVITSGWPAKKKTGFAADTISPKS